MRKFYTFAAFCLMAIGLQAQDRFPSSSMWLRAYPLSGAKVPYAYDGKGTEYKVNWGMDVAWNDAGNVKRGVNYIGTDILNTGRVSYQPTDAVGDDLILSSNQISHLTSRVNNINLSKPDGVMLNLDIPGDQIEKYRANYKGKPYEYYKVIKASVLKYKELGMNIISIAPFNEPDYTYNEVGTKAQFLEIVKYIAADPDLAGIRICAGNTLNDDGASEWYNYMKPYVNEGNTHQLAGNFTNYANFFQEVRRDGNHATADELHNTMEAFVAVHYGLQTGIWWGYDGLARGEFCKATSGGGEELGYGENRSAWAAGCVYRMPSGAVKAFVGVSERQANKNWMDIVSTDRDVFYNGYGPVRLYQEFLPGDGVYGSDNQKNADKVIPIYCGEDVPLDTIGGEYIIMNKKTGKLLAPANTNANAPVYQMTRKNTPLERWNIQPTDCYSGGDFSYYRLYNENQKRYCNLLNGNLDVGGSFILYNAGGYANEQYAFEYAGNGFYYIRNHLSGLYLEASGTTVMRQNVFTGKDTQMWRLMPADAKCEQVAPAAPTGVRTLSHPASVVVSWNANTERDINCYIVIRGYEKDGETIWETIGRKIKGTAFIDNSLEQGKEYVYKVKAVDLSGNRSADSEIAKGSTDGEKTLVAYYEFDKDLYDFTVNQFDGVSCAEASYSTTSQLLKSGTASLNLDGKSNYLMLPNKVADMHEMTISFWMNSGDVSSTWMRVFDFGSDTDHYMFFTPNSGSDSRFVMKNGGSEQILSTSKIGTGWKFIAITIGDDAVKLYVNGEQVASSTDMSIRPSDIKPAMCFVGRSQYIADPLYKGRLDALRIYNYAQTPEEIAADMSGEANAIEHLDSTGNEVVSTEYYTLGGERTINPSNGIFIMKQRYQDGSVKVGKLIVR